VLYNLGSKAKKKNKKSILPVILLILFIPASIFTSKLAFKAWEELKQLPFIEQFIHEKSDAEILMGEFDLAIPLEYIPIYKAASDTYNVPWTLLAAHHRIETRFSTTKSQVSSAGAEGPMQFMPCTFVGWSHPTCSGKGKGNIPEAEKTNLTVIKKHGGYGVDGNGDGKADPYNIYDAVYSAANYLSHSGASEGNLRKAIYTYNHSNIYVADILYYYELYTSYEDELLALVQ
jgi:peptidoglycan LD-endopeptidase LytH